MGLFVGEVNQIVGSGGSKRDYLWGSKWDCGNKEVKDCLWENKSDCGK